MVKKLKPLLVQRELETKHIYIFTPKEFKQIFDVTLRAAQEFIKDHSRGELFTKLKNGLYGLVSRLPSEYEIANKVYQPSYISLDTALSYYHMIPEVIYAMTSVTPKLTREFVTNHIQYSYQKIKKRAFTGYQSQKMKGATILIAEPEKALADYLYFIDLKQRGLHYERLDLRKVKKSKLSQYIKLFERPTMRKLVEEVYAQFRKPQRIY